MALIAAALLIVVGPQFSLRNRLGNQVAQSRIGNASADEIESAVTGFAVISGQADAIWATGESLASDSLVPTGELHLRSGVVQLELFSGVLLVVEGDATFSVISPIEVAVMGGKVRARVPEPAQGFVIRTDEGEVVDLGTEFAANVSDEGSEVHVLDGEIEWHPRGEAAQRMEQGDAVKRSKDGRSVAVSESDFVGSNELQSRLEANQSAGLKRWKESSEQLRNDPRLVAYYQVTHDHLSSRRLPNLAGEQREAPASEGAIVAAASAQGRWGQPSEEAIPQEYLVETVRIGKASLCNWGLPERNQPRFAVRNLNGSLDEFALFDAALSTEEIRKLYVDGRP